MDGIVCAANHTRGIPPCTLRGEHLTTCDSADCTGCAPRPAVHGYLCRRHYEHIDEALRDETRLRRAFTGVIRAMQADGSASTIPGPRVPLSALQLAFEKIERLHQGRGSDTAATWVVTPAGAMQALRYAHAVHTTTRAHPAEPRTERLHRVRCGSCLQVTVVTDPPAIARGRSTLRCVTCGWTTRDADHAEAAAYTEALVRDPYRTGRRRTRLAGEDRAGIARLIDALR